MVNSGRKITLKSPREPFKVNGGAVVNHMNPRSVYINFTSWVSYNEIESLKDIVKNLRTKLRTYFRSNEIVNSYFNQSTIINVNISESRVRLKKPTFFEIDITLYQKNHKEGLPLLHKSNNCLKDVLQSIVNDFFKTDIIDNHGFNFCIDIKEANDKMEKATI